MRRFRQKPVRLDEKELKTDLGGGNFIFVGSSCDMWANDVPDEWIARVLQKCEQHSNPYLFQSKNPARFLEFTDRLKGWNVKKSFLDDGTGVIFATTLESNFDHPEAYTGSILEGQPSIEDRFNGIMRVKQAGYPVTLTIEPILKFDLNRFKEMINDVEASWISLGADSMGHNLPEPTGAEVRQLIRELERNNKVIIKKNLQRLLNQ